MILDDRTKLYLLPFIYYFTLSLTLIFVSSYWLISRTKQAEVAYAQGSDLSMEIKLSGLNDEDIRFVENNLLNCDNKTAKKIDAYFTKKKTPLANHGCVFTAEAQKNNLDPYLTPAIAICESGGGASKTSKAYNNPFGWGINDSAQTRNDDVYVKDSLSDSISVVSAGIARNAIKRNLGTTPSEIVTWYNPGSVGRADGIPENSTWAHCVNIMMSKIAE